MGFDDNAGAASAKEMVPGLTPTLSMAAAAQEMRNASKQEFAADTRKIAMRIQQLGLTDKMSPQAVYAALAPVPDKDFLECISKLPKPGDHLPSRPVLSARGKGKSGKKARAASAARSRPGSPGKGKKK